MKKVIAVMGFLILGITAQAEQTKGVLAARTNGLQMVGTVTYNYNGAAGTLEMTASQIENTRAAGSVSGTLLLTLWATTTPPVFGQTITHYTLGTYTLGQLNGGFSFFSVDTGLIGFTPAPTGTYYITMALLEYDGTEYVYQDLRTFSNTATFGNPTSCSPTSTSLCLNANRFRVTTTWQTATGSGNGTAVALTGDTGYFWFFSSGNVEMVVKVVDGRPLNNKFWVFAGGLTNVYVTIQVTDTVTGAVRYYTNPLNTAFQPIQDTAAF